jgi:hypothetical protein
VLLYFSHIQEMSCSIGFTGGQSTGCPDLVICRPSAVALNRPYAAANSVSLTPTVTLAHDDTPVPDTYLTVARRRFFATSPATSLGRHRHRRRRRHITPFFHVFFHLPLLRVPTGRFQHRPRSARSLLLPGRNVGLLQRQSDFCSSRRLSYVVEHPVHDRKAC